MSTLAAVVESTAAIVSNVPVLNGPRLPGLACGRA